MHKISILSSVGINLSLLLIVGCNGKSSSETETSQGESGILTLTLIPSDSETSEGTTHLSGDSTQVSSTDNSTSPNSASNTESAATTDDFPDGSSSNGQNTTGFGELEPCAVEEPEPVTYEKYKPINMLFVIDSSGSMSGFWDEVQDAVFNVTDPNESFVQFGLKLAPGIDDVNQGGNGCFYEDLEVVLAKNTADEINNAIKNHSDFGISPFYDPLQFAYEKLAAYPSNFPKYITIISDAYVGSCTGEFDSDDLIKLVSDAYIKKSISTYVVSLGDDWDKDVLNQVAAAGGVPNEEGADKFYKGDLNLDETLKTIVEGKLGCTLEVTKVPPEPANMMVEINKTPYQSVPKGEPCPVEGGYYWLAEPSLENNFIGQISLCGSACTALEIFNTAQFKFYCAIPG